METIYLIQKPKYQKAYYSFKRLCKEEGIDFSKLPDEAKKKGFTVGNIIVSILEIDNRV